MKRRIADVRAEIQSLDWMAMSLTIINSNPSPEIAAKIVDAKERSAKLKEEYPRWKKPIRGK